MPVKSTTVAKTSPKKTTTTHLRPGVCDLAAGLLNETKDHVVVNSVARLGGIAADCGSAGTHVYLG